MPTRVPSTSTPWTRNSAQYEVLERRPVHLEVRERLPPVRHDEVVAVALAAAQVEDDALAARHGHELVEAAPRQRRPVEEPRRHDDVRRAPLEPLGRVRRRHAAADLQPARVGRERRARGLLVARAELDHVAARQPVAAVHLRVVLRAQVAHEVLGRGASLVVPQCPTNNLLDLAVVQVDAGSEFHRCPLVLCSLV